MNGAGGVGVQKTQSSLCYDLEGLVRVLYSHCIALSCGYVHLNCAVWEPLPFLDLCIFKCSLALKLFF